MKTKEEIEELKDTVTCLRVELDKQKTRFKRHIAKLEQENEELRKIKKAYEDNYEKWRDEKVIEIKKLREELKELRANNGTKN